MSNTETEIKNGIAEIIAEEIGVPAADITPGKLLVGDLDIDSLSRLTIITQVEDQFKITIPDDAIDGFDSVADLVVYVAAAQGGTGIPPSPLIQPEGDLP
ncbi:MAG: acyl carrier protein [Promicromonosporaceae bacterium]|nr:acyl carrier protein [Promicromonosporaceae bacterium]